MLKSYFKIAFRNLWRKRAYSLINISGLAVGMACCFLIFLYVHFELSYDRYHQRADRIYRVVGDVKSSSETLHWYETPGPLGRSIKNDFPQVLEVTRFINASLLIRKGNFKFQETHSIWADSSIFSVFDLPLIYGNPRTALSEPNSIVMSEAAALKYFGHSNPVGQHLLLTGLGLPAIVTGLMKDIPENSHFRPNVLVSMSTYTHSFQPGVEQDWGSFLYSTYLLLSPGSDPLVLQSKLPALIQKYEGSELRNRHTRYDLKLEPLASIYLHSSYGAPVTGNLDNVLILTAIGIFILLLAAVNFINMSTARSIERAKEVGIRKCAGARRRQLIGQFLIESMLIATVSFFLALSLCQFLLPLFNQLSGKTISIGIFASLSYPIWLLVLGLSIGLLAGVYPAVVLSSFKPVSVLKGRFVSGSRGAFLRKALVVTQYTISISLVVSTLVVYSQLNFMERQPLGFDKDQMLIVSNNGDRGTLAFQRDIAAMPAVQASSLTSSVPGRTYNASGNDVWPSDVENSKGEKQQLNLAYNNVDAEFLSLYKIKLLAGRDFYKSGNDDSTGVILNKTAALSLGYSESTLQQLIGKKVHGQGDNFSSIVIGVMDDFHFHSLREPIIPLCLTTSRGYWQYLSVRINTNNLAATLSAIGDQWQKAVPNRPFTYFFLDEDFNSQYSSEESFGHLFICFSALALFISSLGLLGLSSYNTLQRTKEIGIRKVLGATVSNIVGLLSADFVKLVVIAFVIACPVSWLAMHQWLDGFAYRTRLNVNLFLVAGAGAILIALLTTSIQAINAALANPVNSLRAE
ncbi:MAG TPA: ABC transporter permease [Puia sp.]|nr:ABC transporter permease [Puia sp.]